MIPSTLNMMMFGVAASGDPDWSSVSSLLHFDGADASTTFTDETGKTWTANGNAQIDTAIKENTASGLFDGTGDYITTPDHADFDLGSGDFTIELSVYIPTAAGGDIVIINKGGFPTTKSAFMFWFGTGATLGLYSSSNNTSWDIASNVTIATITRDTWIKLAVTRSGNDFKTFADGVLVSSFSSSSSLYNSTDVVTIAASNTATFTANIQVDNFRITKGVARYTATYTVTTDPFPSS